MKTKKITEEQLQELFLFMQRKRVRYYDLQVELVDHFASAIEDLWRENPQLSFSSALEKVYSRFPITGFTSVIANQQKAVKQEAWRWIFRTWIAYFKWPKSVLFVTVFLSFQLLFQLSFAGSPVYWILLVLLLASGIWMVFLTKKSATRKGKRFLKLEATYDAVSHVVNGMNGLIYIILVVDPAGVPEWFSWLAAFFVSALVFIAHILFFQLPKRAEEELSRHFPKYV